MKKAMTLSLFLSFSCFLPAAEYDSALAPYPYFREAPYCAEAETLLTQIEANAPADGAFAVSVSWTCRSERNLDPEKNKFGPFSLKSAPNWHRPPEGYWKEGTCAVEGIAPVFRIEKPADPLSPADWWHKDGENIFARAFCDDWHNVWRFHHDALESGMLGYADGLGLVLWAFQPAYHLRRAENLEQGEDQVINGTSYKTLIATPNWIKKPLFLENRTHYPFNHSTILSWAPLKPEITYYIDPATGVIAASKFEYYHCYRSDPKDWKTVAKPGRVVIFSQVATFSRTPAGTWYPARITGEVYKEDTFLRSTTFQVTLRETPLSLKALALPKTKRLFDPWPLYRSAVYAGFINDGEINHATRVGLARSLAYEGYSAEAFSAIGEALAAMEEDKTLSGQTWGGIDWELGFALYENFCRYNDAELETFWSVVPKTEAWLNIARRAVELYGRYWPKDTGRIAQLVSRQKLLYEQARLPSYRAQCLAVLRANLEKRAEAAQIDKDKEYYEKLASEVRAELERISQ